MRTSFLMCLVLATSGAAFAQTQVPDTSGMETRYVNACLKEDSAAYCHCEFQAVTRLVHDPKDLAFFVQLEEETAGKPDQETDKIIAALPQDRQKLVSTTQQQLAPLVKSCPDYSQHHH